MAHEEDEDTTVYRVVLNDEEMYSTWPVTRELPAGWREEGTTGTKQECLDRIEAVWTDMRPLSVRRATEADRQSS
jgi:MbtH protein